MGLIEQLADELTLGALIARLRRDGGPFEILGHWKQGEFHHDTLLRLEPATPLLPGPVLIVATNCNGGVKEVVCLDELPERDALWHWRCPDNSEFEALPLPGLRAVARTEHWFDPSELCSETARSELRPEFRKRQKGGGWAPR